MDLIDCVAVVTGGGGGIGRAAALMLADAGAHIVVIDRIPERCEEVVGRVRERGRKAIGIAADVRDSAALTSSITDAAEQFGRLDILVNNAGGTNSAPFLEQAEAQWRRSIDLNLVSTLAATSAVVPVMIAGGRGGSIITVSSIEGTRAAPGYAVYAACKAAVLNFTRTAALEFAEHGIRVNAITPDYSITPGVRGNTRGPVDPTTWSAPGRSHELQTAARIPLGRPGTADECASAILFLASSMSSYVTGATLPVDGGTSASSGWMRGASGSWGLTPGGNVLH